MSNIFKGRIFVCADLHGSSARIQEIINQIDNPTENDVIIIAGDAGFEYGNRVMGAAKKYSKKFPGYWVVLRGNHDDCYWKNHPDWLTLQGENGANFLYQKKYPKILYIFDGGGIYKIGNYNFLMIPGAYSVDKKYRLAKHYPYNVNEQLTYKEKYELEELVIAWNDYDFPIDYVIAHTFPLYLEHTIKDLYLDFINQNDVDKSTEQWLDQMAGIYECNKDFKHYYGGHFHSDRDLNDKYTMVYRNVIQIGEK